MYDILIVGGGPAGVSAALTAHSRGREVLLLGNPIEENPLSKAERVDNYPGMPSVGGRELLEVMHGQLTALGIPAVTGKAVQIMSLGNYFACAAGSEVYEAKSVILAVGHMPKAGIPGETEYLGRGVSYCATCDGMLYRGRDVAVLGFSGEAAAEAAFLASIGCGVKYFGRGERPSALGEAVAFQSARQFRILGDDQRVAALEADGLPHPVSGVFILRPAMAADSLLPGVEVREGHIVTDAHMATAVPGVFAAGDCVGKPYQIAKAAGEGNIAALSADRWLKKQFLDITERNM